MKSRTLFMFVMLAGTAALADRAALAQTPATFDEPRNFGSGSAQAVAIADFNGDGAPDAATLGADLTVYLNNGNGYFTQAPAIGISGFYIVAADFNGDGFADLAVAGTSGLIILLGNGDGSFRPPTLYPATLTSLAAGDFNGDGIADVAAFGNGKVQVFFGSSSGVLQPGPTSGPVCTSSLSTSVSADFNGDGKADLASTNCSSGLVVLLGQGDGSFAAPVQYQACEAASVSALVVADFNGDGAPDMACAAYVSVDILINNGKGKFTVSKPNKFPQILNSLAVGDWNGDGRADLMMGGSGIATFLAGRGDATFATGQQFVLAYDSNALAVADFNGDGVPDVASANGIANYTSPPPQPPFTVLLGAGHGKFQSSRAFDVGAAPGGMAIADFNGDGKPDVAIANYSAELAHVTPDPSNIEVLMGDGAGGLATPVDYAAHKPTAVAVGDANGDGKLDLLFVGDNVVGTLAGNGDGTFAAAVDSPCKYCGGALVVADFNGDGKLDLATPGDAISVLLGNGDGTFQLPLHSGDVTPATLATADFNNDGHPDLLYSTTSSVYILLGEGDGTFGSPILISDSGTLGVTGDFNGDGNVDIAVALISGLGVAIYLGNGDGTFTPAYTIEAQANGSQILVGDFNGDGIPDLICPLGVQPGNTDGMATVLLGIGNGDFTVEPQQYVIVSGGNDIRTTSALLGAGDFNGDGKLDVVSIGTPYAAWVLLNTTGR